MVSPSFVQVLILYWIKLIMFSLIPLADSSNSLNRFYHKSGLALAVLAPVSFILSPSPINMPVDLLLGVLFPFHSHVALNYIVSDYVPKAQRSMARFAVMGTTLVALAGKGG